MASRILYVSQVLYAGGHAANTDNTVIGIEVVGGETLQVCFSPGRLEELRAALERLAALRETGHYDAPLPTDDAAR